MWSHSVQYFISFKKKWLCKTVSSKILGLQKFNIIPYGKTFWISKYCIVIGCQGKRWDSARCLQPDNIHKQPKSFCSAEDPEYSTQDASHLFPCQNNQARDPGRLCPGARCFRALDMKHGKCVMFIFTYSLRHSEQFCREVISLLWALRSLESSLICRFPLANLREWCIKKIPTTRHGMHLWSQYSVVWGQPGLHSETLSRRKRWSAHTRTLSARGI